MRPHIFHIDLYFIFLREQCRLFFVCLLTVFHMIVNSKKALPLCSTNPFRTVLMMMMNLLLCKQTYLRRRSTFRGQLFGNVVIFVFRWLSIFCITHGRSLDTSLYLSLRAALAVQLCFPVLVFY
jgi:hypothetical protein